MHTKVYQLQAIDKSGRVQFSERVWATPSQAEKRKDNFQETVKKKGLATIIEINIITLELVQNN